MVEDYASAMRLYEELKAMSDLHKAAADTYVRGKPLKADVLENKLKPLKNMSNEQLEAIVSQTAQAEPKKKPFGLPPLTRPQAVAGLATIILALAAVYTLGAAPLAAATYTLPLY